MNRRDFLPDPNKHACCEDANLIVCYDRTFDSSEGKRWRFEQDGADQGPEIKYCPFCGEELPLPV